MSWEKVLTHIKEGDHVAQIYQDEGFLVDAVCLYMATGIKRHEAVVLIATKEHAELFNCRLEARGIDVSQVKARGQLKILDAHTTLNQFMVKGMPDAVLFQSVITPIILQTKQHYSKLRAYGEMVNVLWQDKNLSAAVRLEEIWNDFMKVHSFSLFCAYTMDGLDQNVNNGPLQCVCKNHSHFIPAQDYTQFEKALNEASQKILGCSLTNMLQTIALENKKISTQMPPAQIVLLWLKEHMPVTANKILAQTREYLTLQKV
jgi:hypothetical protein